MVMSKAATPLGGTLRPDGREGTALSTDHLGRSSCAWRLAREAVQREIHHAVGLRLRVGAGGNAPEETHEE